MVVSRLGATGRHQRIKFETNKLQRMSWDKIIEDNAVIIDFTPITGIYFN